MVSFAHLMVLALFFGPVNAKRVSSRTTYTEDGKAASNARDEEAEVSSSFYEKANTQDEMEKVDDELNELAEAEADGDEEQKEGLVEEGEDEELDDEEVDDEDEEVDDEEEKLMPSSALEGEEVDDEEEVLEVDDEEEELMPSSALENVGEEEAEDDDNRASSFAEHADAQDEEEEDFHVHADGQDEEDEAMMDENADAEAMMDGSEGDKNPLAGNPCGGEFAVMMMGPYGYRRAGGNKPDDIMTGRQTKFSDQYPTKDMAVVDAVFFKDIITENNAEEARGSSRGLYWFAGLDWFPRRVTTAVKKMAPNGGDAFYHEYRTAGESKSDRDINLIHVMTPDLRRSADAAAAEADLKKAYHSVMREFVKSGKSTLRLLPLSDGIWSGETGKFGDQIEKLTFKALKGAVADLAPAEKSSLKSKTIQMCVYMEDKFEPYWLAARDEGFVHPE